jgi:GH25 family lysozyme M1 (1,4-beta-N-acetylmuramidase)
MSTKIDGVDVSKWQGKIDWQEAQHQLGFAMFKATEGVSEIDTEYVRNIGAARKAGLHRGSYHYPDAGDPVAEADYYVKHAHRKNGEMQALDFEGAVLNLKDPVGWAAKWLRRVIAKTDNCPLIYMSGSTVHRFDWSRVIKLNAGLWCASWDSAKPDPGQWPFVIMWQRADDGKLTGINGQVDEDVFFGNPSTWAAYANNRSTKTVKAKKPAAKKPAPAKPAPAPAKPAPKPPAPKPAAPTKPKEHIVREGDSLSGIAAAAGVSVKQLVAWNKGKYASLGWNPDLIDVGWELRVSA